jgi:DNA-binding response OmpR family regulator
MSANLGPRGRAGTIVIVEDDGDILELLRELFEEEGWNVRACADGREALSTISRSAASLVLLDLVLPGLDGSEILRKLRDAPSTAHLPVLVMTAGAPSEPVPGANGFIQKPFSADDLLALIARLTEEPARFPMPPAAGR